MKPKVLFVASYFESDCISNYTMPFIDRQMESLREAGLDITSFSIESFRSKYNYIKKSRLLRDYLKENRVDIVHAHYSYAGLTCGISKIRPLVVSLMGTDVYGRVGKSLADRTINFINRMIIRLLASRWDAVIVKSEQMKKFISHSNLHVIPNGVDFGKFYPMDRLKAQSLLNLDPHKTLILFGGNPDNPRKNYALAREVFKLVSLEIQDISMIHLKNIPHQEIPVYLSACSCLLMTSIMEGSPNILKEALACNLPVVSVRVGDAEERLAGMDMCRICSYDPMELARNVTEVIGQGLRPDNRSRIQDLEIGRVADRITSVYHQVLEQYRQGNAL
ncbi:glycosyl transferase group 1 [Desulfonatronospira thiodismutans ASO3-1]|uniref:Glycosyl transferase group 1 n=1 Tax=Desulfonatronospira thiodismutans ASO3-1 TaxID=555779 RepID=D6SKV2_9BACT|nr:glycosyltransferase [Desulfonatronospira thiodismutans]EFI35313.1 glycosyl transferase group 1 [Desulfonatronospira thiodismutans ASO3-1]